MNKSCDTCIYGHVALQHGTEFRPDADFHSFAIHPNCTLTFSEVRKNKTTLFSKTFNSSDHDIQRDGISGFDVSPLFKCECSDLELDGTKLPFSETEPANFIQIGIRIGGAILAILISVTLYLALRRRWKSSETSIDGEDWNADKCGNKIRRNDINFDPENILGSGKYGVVISAQLKISEDKIIEVAVKKVKPNADRNYFTSLVQELKVLSYLGQHPNVVTLVGYCRGDLDDNELYLVLELCSERCLKDYLKNNRCRFLNLVDGGSGEWNSAIFKNYSIDESCQFSTLTLVKWAAEIANGMDYLASKKVVHIDLSARNILISQTMACKIGDFGLSGILSDDHCYTKRTPEDPIPWPWMAMESLNSHTFTTKSDVWSFGVTLWEIFSLYKEPYEHISNHVDLYEALATGYRMGSSKFTTQRIYSKIQRCWNEVPNERPTFAELRTFFAQTHTEQTECHRNIHMDIPIPTDNERGYVSCNFLMEVS